MSGDMYCVMIPGSVNLPATARQVIALSLRLLRLVNIKKPMIYFAQTNIAHACRGCS